MANIEPLRLFAPVIKVTGAYACLFFIFMCFQSFSKFYIFNEAKKKAKKDDSEKVSLRQIKYNSTSGLGFISDRTFLNMLEQSPLFLMGLWMHAVFVSPESAATAGWLYIVFRAMYPIVFSMGIPWLFVSTFTNYFVVWYLIGTTVHAAMTA
jgi:uncharacterized MAPEG superfamily protein